MAAAFWFVATIAVYLLLTLALIGAVWRASGARARGMWWQS